MFIVVLFSILLFEMSYAVNTKHLTKHNLTKHNLIKSQRESYSCQIIKQRQREYLIQHSNSKHKQPYKPLYIPESKNCR